MCSSFFWNSKKSSIFLPTVIAEDVQHGTSATNVCATCVRKNAHSSHIAMKLSLCVLVALFVTQQCARAACPASFAAGPRSGTCYHISWRRNTFKQCEQDVCVPLNSTLPKIKNYDEVRDVAEMLGEEESAWIGLTDHQQRKLYG